MRGSMAAAKSLDPANIRAVITTKWTKSGYRPVTLRGIESYRVDSQMDQDADTFTIVMGDPRNALGASLNRDSEVRIQLFGLGKNVTYLHTGIVDEAEFDEENRLTLTGRDLSAVAADTTAIAGIWRNMKINDFIAMRVKALKIGAQLNLAHTRVRPKISTDGSETEWEMWYRLVRSQSQWLWFTSDGVLTSGTLNYNQQPSYYFGTPHISASGSDRARWIPCELVAYRKTTQTRIGELALWWHVGNEQRITTVKDQTTDEWIKRPFRYLESNKIHSVDGARKHLYEEIFESKVGALEIKIRVPDTGIVVKQNTIATLRIPEMDLGGNWFVVGSTL